MQMNTDIHDQVPTKNQELEISGPETGYGELNQQIFETPKKHSRIVSMSRSFIEPQQEQELDQYKEYLQRTSYANRRRENNPYPSRFDAIGQSDNHQQIDRENRASLIAQKVLNDPGHGNSLMNMRQSQTFNERSQGNQMQNFTMNDNYDPNLSHRIPKQSDSSIKRNLFDQAQEKPRTARYESPTKDFEQPKTHETLQGSFNRNWNKSSKNTIPQRSVSLTMNNTIDVINPNQYAFEDGKFLKL